MSAGRHDASAVLPAVEELTDRGSLGFYASAIVAETGLPAPEVSERLIEMVKDSKLELRFELRCPDNGRRIAAYDSPEEIPLGEEIESDRCESGEPFIADETDVFVRFVPARKFAASVRRKKSGAVDDPRGNPGKVGWTRRWRGRVPRLSLP